MRDLVNHFVQYKYHLQQDSTLCLKKVPTFKLSVTLSNLNRFSNVLHCWQAYEETYIVSHHTLDYVATLPWVVNSDVKRGQILEAKAASEDKSWRTRTRTRTNLRGQGQVRAQKKAVFNK